MNITKCPSGFAKGYDDPFRWYPAGSNDDYIQIIAGRELLLPPFHLKAARYNFLGKMAVGDYFTVETPLTKNRKNGLYRAAQFRGLSLAIRQLKSGGHRVWRVE